MMILIKTLRSRRQAGRSFTVLASLVVVAAIVLLTLDVVREMRAMQTAQSDNVQWSLSQTEVEFLELLVQTEAKPVDLRELRRRFDVFYSRITIISRASVFETLRDDMQFAAHLTKVSAFLDRAVSVVDMSDEDLVSAIPELKPMIYDVRDDVRDLSVSGLGIFALAADSRRLNVARTMTELAIFVVSLMAALALSTIYLNRVNIQARLRERDLKNTMRRIDTITNTSLDGVIVSDQTGRILDFSPAAEVIFGCRSQDVLGCDLGEVFVPDHFRAQHAEGINRMRRGEAKRIVGHGRVTLEAKRASGEIFPIELAIQSAQTDEGEIYIAFVRDISARLAAETELVRARDKALANEKLQSDFLATMSHEIRTPLNGLMGNMTLLGDTTLTAQQLRYLKNMETSGRLLLGHVSDVLDITRYDSGKLKIAAIPVDVARLLQDIVDTQRSMAEKNETKLAWSWVGDPVKLIDTDPNRLQPILMNLIGNAVKFTQGGQVQVSVTTVGQDAGAEQLRFDVVDTGPGMSFELSQRVFDDFVTGSSAYDREVGGTGLGLSIARRFAKAFGGSIGVDSVEGRGSRFWVTIPLIRSDVANRPLPAKPVVQKRTSLDVLVVEDNEVNRLIVREMLQSDGHSVTEAFDGQAGVAQANLKHFDLILMDISMPVMDGRKATRKIREGCGPCANKPIFALTANALPEEQKKFYSDGMNAILTKPLSRTALRAALSGVEASPDVVPVQIVDPAHTFETRKAVGLVEFDKLLTGFTQECDALVERFRTTENADMNDVAARAHKVAGSAAVFGAVDMRDGLKEIETYAKSNDRDAMVIAMLDLPKRWGATKKEFVTLFQ